MASSEEESIEPVGFTLKIPKFQRSSAAVKRKRYGIKYKRPYSSESQSDVLSLSPIKEDYADLFDIEIDSPCSEATEKSTPQRKKRPRKDVLASISANAKRLPIPIPSFQMIRKNTEERSKKLRQLERAFFDEDDDENDSTMSNQGETIDLTAQSNSKETTASDNERYHVTNTIRNQSFVKKTLSPSFDNQVIVEGKEREHLEKSVPAEQSCSVGDHQIVENNDMVKDMVETSEDGFSSKTGERIDNNPENDEKEDGYDTNCADFGEDGGDGCDFDDATEGNCQDIPSTDGYDKATVQTNIVTTTKPTLMETTDIGHNDSSMPQSFDLDHQVHLLFQKTDTTAMSMNMFRKELERRMGVSLSKPEKKRVKARVLALLKGETVQLSDTEKTIGTSVAHDTAVDEGDTNNDATNPISKESAAFENETAKYDNSKNDTNSKQGFTKNNNPSGTVNVVTETASVSGRDCEVEVIHVECSSNNSNTEETEKKRNISSRSKEEAEKETTASSSKIEGVEKEIISLPLSKEETATETIPSSPNTGHAEREITISTREPIVEKKKDAKKRQQKKGKNVSKGDIGKEKSTNTESNSQSKSKTEKPKAKRQRKSKPKNSDVAETSSDAQKAAPQKKPTQTRKRPRKAAACALCKTCPCQRHTESENIATLDMKNFSRSDDAVERTLIRRLQKLEKSTESMEEQTETVRRRLKKHRRDMTKRRERQQESVSNGDKTGDSYFLPDAEVFERQQSESGGLPGRVVGRAQNRIFQNVPTYQPTLFEMMGIPRDSDKTKHNADSDAIDGSGNAGEARVSHDPEQIGNDEDDDDMPAEYVPERKRQEKIHRFEWNNGAGDNADREGDIASGSIFDTVLPFTQVDDEMDAPKDGTSVPLWDDLFDSKKQERKQADTDDPIVGLDDLLCLFADGKEGKDNEGDGDDRIDPTLLSQGAKAMANEVISSVSSETLSASYPNWKENIYFAMTQKDPNELSQALENVQESKKRLQAEKEEMLRAWECKHTALQVFEKALKTSFDYRRSKTSMELEK